jgi:hypothetical protein
MLFSSLNLDLDKSSGALSARRCLAVFALSIASLFGTHAQAQSMAFQGGLSRMASPSESTYAWGFTYAQP